MTRIGPCMPACALALFATAGHAANPEWSGKATMLAGAPIADGQQRSGRAALQPRVKWKPSDGLELRGEVRMRWLEQQRLGRRDLDVRELTASWRGEETTLTVGAQQINWGRMDILRVTDIVNPVDQNDLLYEDLPEAKLALWMANWEWQSGPHTVQLVATPQPSVDRLPQRLQGLPVDVSEPKASARNATLAARFGLQAADWNVDLLAIRGWRSTASLQPVVGPAGIRLRGAPVRQDSVGFSADRPLGNTVFRIEGLWARAAVDQGAVNGPRKSGTLGTGLDLTSGSWFVAGQVIGSRNLDPGGAEGRSRNQAFVSVIVQRKWLQDRLSTRLTAIRETAGDSSWTSLQLSYELSSNHLLRLQGDVFRGASQTPFGSFVGRSRVALSMEMRL